jgi:arginase
MPIAALLGMGDEDFSHIAGENPVLRPEHIVYVGLRDIDPPEEAMIRQLGIKTYIMKDIPEGEGYVAAVLQRALIALQGQVDYLVISIDLDAFDPRYAPSVGSPVGDGFNRQEVLDAMRHVAKTRPPDMVEIVEYNPALGGAAETYDLLRDVLNAILKN